jgi:NAD(P)-dependent dehydrogenase (short-subunit alcohol dehydrogenase family)
MPEIVDPQHLLLIGAGPGVGAGVVRRFGREGFRSTLISHGKAALRSAQTLIAAGVHGDGVHAATITIAGAVKPGTDFDPDIIAELFWTGHTDSKDAWQTEYRFTGA